MNTYKHHRFPPDIISYAVWLYYRFNLSHRDIEDLLAERGIIVSREVGGLATVSSISLSREFNLDTTVITRSPFIHSVNSSDH